MAGRGGYSWVADIRARVDVARGVAQGPGGLQASPHLRGGHDEGAQGRHRLDVLARRPALAAGERHEARHRLPEGTRHPRAREPTKGATARISPKNASARIARDAMEVHDLAELRRLASTVGTAREVRAMSLDGLDLAVGRARSRGDERAADRISQARDHASERRLLPEHESHDDSTGGTHASGTGEHPPQAGPGRADRSRAREGPTSRREGLGQMRVDVSYADGRLESFDTDRFTRAEPFAAKSMLADLALAFCEDGSLVLRADCYDVRDVGDGAMARRRRGWAFLLVSCEEAPQGAVRGRRRLP